MSPRSPRPPDRSPVRLPGGTAPPSFELPVEEAVVDLPTISVIVRQERESEDGRRVNYVPIDPCQPVIMGVRVAIGEGIYRAYIDRDTTTFEAAPFVSP